MKARAILTPRDNYDSGLERRYAMHLTMIKAAGEIADFARCGIKLRLADKTWYQPDFVTVRPDGSMTFIEVKGFWRDDARVKIKVAAELYAWFGFMAVTWDAKSRCWCREEF